jgi:hypothetical protein
VVGGDGRRKGSARRKREILGLESSLIAYILYLSASFLAHRAHIPSLKHNPASHLIVNSLLNGVRRLLVGEAVAAAFASLA